MLDIKITKTTSPKAKPTGKLGFGKIFSDHMFVMDYTAGEGWHDARVVPYGPWEMDPATTVFHYAQEIFEGMKAYRTISGSRAAVISSSSRISGCIHSARTMATRCFCPPDSCRG